MGKVFERIDEHQRRWIASQPLFFVGSAPLADDGHVNISPKGPIETLKVLDDHTVAYLDMMGSGAETAAHLRENGRIVVMMCAFQGPPRVLRLHGRGEVIPSADERYAELFARAGFPESPVVEAERAIILVALDRISDSCGYSVPLMSYDGEREHYRLAAEKHRRKGELATNVADKNAISIDGLPAFDGLAIAAADEGVGAGPA
ncbi:MAG: pyridoxamine 5'-phosphate oxidase family protein [Actinobacteria bacterium]|nr:pyridoxamine 5'-phosphate oxidase family protein [Actinomycetota bacterium]